MFFRSRRWFDLPSLGVFNALASSKYAEKIAIQTHKHGYTYAQLEHDSHEMSLYLKNHTSHQDKVAFLFHPGYRYITAKLGIWRSMNVGVPLCHSHPTSELEYSITNSKASTVLYDQIFYDTLAPLIQKLKNVNFLAINPIPPRQIQKKESQRIPYDDQLESMIIYTSGTTSRPKGVVTTHKSLESQMDVLINAWKWNEADHLLHVLPLHHVHGVLILLNTLKVGGTVEFSKFKEVDAWKKLLEGKINLFMAVPTIYQKLLKFHHHEIKTSLVDKLKHIRLMVSGSASLPDTIFEKWHEVTGHTLLERYGMTEIGLVISNPLVGKRLMGYVGLPFPGVELKIYSHDNSDTGELFVKGPTLFKEYFENPNETEKSFENGWFKTGDFVHFDKEKNSYKILGRISMDIIKSGGFKISALEIERILLKNEKIHEVAVLGIPDEEWGQRVAMVYVGEEIGLEECKSWCKEHLAPYKIPTRTLRLKEMPRNAMGKVNKKCFIELF